MIHTLQFSLRRIAEVLSLLSIVGILLVLILVDRSDLSWFYHSMYLSNAWIAGILIVLFIFLWKAPFLAEFRERFSNAKSDAGLSKKLWISTGLLLILQGIILHSIFLYVDYDVNYMKEAASQFIHGGLSDFYVSYFATNTNNVIVLGINILFQLLGEGIGIDGYLIQVVFGVLLVDTTIHCTAMVTCLVTGKKSHTLVTYILMVLLLGLSPWIMAPYTDVFSLLVPVGTLYLYLKLRDCRMNVCLKTILIFGPSIVCIQLKPTNAVIALSILIVEILRERELISWKKLGQILLGFVIIAGCFLILQRGVYAALSYEPNEARAKTALHYMLLGSNTSSGGCYNWDDDAYTDSYLTAEEKNAADWALIKERYTSMGFSGFLYHLTKKTDMNYNSGTFGWGKEVPTVHQLLPSDGSFLTTFLRNLYYVDGDTVYLTEGEKTLGVSRAFQEGGAYFGYFTLTEQFLWIMVLLLILKASISVFRSKGENSYRDILLIAFLGMFLFVTIFETNSRYLLSYLPIFVLLAVEGITIEGSREKRRIK